MSRYHQIVSVESITRFGRSQFGKQLGRFVRLVAVGLAVAYVASSAITAVAAVGVAEVAFRAVWPT